MRGKGLGLASISWRLKRIGWDVRLESTVGVGSRFILIPKPGDVIDSNVSPESSQGQSGQTPSGTEGNAPTLGSGGKPGANSDNSARQANSTGDETAAGISAKSAGIGGVVPGEAAPAEADAASWALIDFNASAFVIDPAIAQGAEVFLSISQPAIPAPTAAGALPAAVHP